MRSRRALTLVVALCLLLTEIAIARYAPPGGFIRTSVGDILVIALIYAVIRGATPAQPRTAFIVSLALGLIVELLQLLHVGDALGVPHGSILWIMLGSTFSWVDLLMYTIGGVVAIGVDQLAVDGP